MQRKLTVLFTIFTLIIGLFAGTLPAVQAADWSDAQTVAEIKQLTGITNGGTSNPKVKITAYLTSKDAKSGSNTVFVFADKSGNSDFKSPTAIQIPASSTGVGDAAKRALISNAPLGTLFGLEGTVDLYNNVFSIEKVTNAEIIEPGTGEEPPAEDHAVLPIADARARQGQTVTIEGIVTADNSAIGGGKLSTYVQDATGGINVYSGSKAGFPDLMAGDLVQIKGTITSYNNLMEIVPEANGITVLKTGQPLPAAQDITLSDLLNPARAEAFEGELVRVRGFIENIPASPAGGGYNVTIIDSNFQSLTLRVMEGSLPISFIEAGKWYDFTAIVGQFKSDYQLIPRTIDDTKLADPQPEAPIQSGEYTSVVASVVDGDTVHLATPVLGSTKVRFVNIDTPETYHKIITPSDANQKEHGEAAKAYLNTLLKAGDEVKVIVGEEAKDSYGRLLAQIVRSSDNLNTNLEMVRQGYASTYFIWPIGSISDYEKFQAAVKEAKDSGRGIWNPANPLMELPFAFRAREQGKGFTRFVGNYTKKIYSAPEQWNSVPVEERVFFSSKDEAEANGYTADITAPVTKASADGVTGDIYGNKDVKVAFEAADAGIGVEKTEYRINNGGWTEGNEVIVASESENIFEYRSIDKVGNIEEAKTLKVKIDKTQPVIMAPDELSINYHEELTLEITADDALSGLKRLSVTLDGQTVDSRLLTDPFTLSVGQHTIEVTAEDQAGNETVKSIPVEVKSELDKLDELLAAALDLQYMDSNIHNSLQAKATEAQKAKNNHVKSNILQAIQNSVKAQAGKKIDRSFSEVLIQDIEEIRESLK